MKNKNYRVSRATLYNTIELLLDCALVRKHQFGHSIQQTSAVPMGSDCSSRLQKCKNYLSRPEEIFNLEAIGI